LRIFVGVAAHGVFGDRDVDMGDVLELDGIAQFERGVDRGVAESAARVRLELVAVLREIS
jgi:hypothetical protein